MGAGERSSLGVMRAAISNEIVRLQAEYYGKGPTRAKTYISEDLVVVVLEESFTRAKRIAGPVKARSSRRSSLPATPPGPP